MPSPSRRLDLGGAPQALLLAALLPLTACAGVPADRGVEFVNAQARAHVGAEPAAAGASDTAKTLDALLARPLDASAAVRIALLNSPRVQEAMARLDVASADLSAAVLPPNPLVEAMRLEPKGGGSATLDFGLSVPLLDLLLTPQRGRAGRAEFEAARAEAATLVVKTALETRSAFIDYLAALQTTNYLRQNDDAGRAGATFADALFEAGNIAKVDRDREWLFAAEVTGERLEFQGEAPAARDHLNALLGLSGPRAKTWTLSVRLPDPPDAVIDVTAAEERALTHSLALKATKARVVAAATRRGVAVPQSLLGDIELKGAAERDDGAWKRGGGVGLTVPIFGFGGPARAKADAELRAAEADLRAQDVELRANARALAARMEAARMTALHRRDVVIPSAEEAYKSVGLDFNAMQIGLFQLLEARRERLKAGRDYIDAVKSYWIAKGELDALGAFATPDALNERTDK